MSSPTKTPSPSLRNRRMKPSTGQRCEMDDQQVEVLVAVEVGPARLRVIGFAEPGVDFGEHPAAAAVGAVVAHQGGVRGERGVVPDRRQQQVEIAVVVVVGPGDRVADRSRPDRCPPSSPATRCRSARACRRRCDRARSGRCCRRRDRDRHRHRRRPRRGPMRPRSGLRVARRCRRNSTASPLSGPSLRSRTSWSTTLTL